MFVCNFTPMERPITACAPRRKQEADDSDDPNTGNGVERPKVYKPVKQNAMVRSIRSHIRCSHMEWRYLSFENSEFIK
ncbi:MAG: hypothetical protein ACLTGA_11955 [Roseburia sp.]